VCEVKKKKDQTTTSKETEVSTKTLEEKRYFTTSHDTKEREVQLEPIAVDLNSLCSILQKEEKEKEEKEAAALKDQKLKPLEPESDFVPDVYSECYPG
jgi:hypothetical protein